MTVDSRIAELQKRHDALSDQVEKAQRNPGMDDVQITEWKREKLRLKEEIARLRKN